MSVVRRRREAIDALEHAMQGVQTDDPHRIESRSFDSGLIGKSSTTRVRMAGDTPVEHEVIVVMPALPRSKRLR